MPTNFNNLVSLFQIGDKISKSDVIADILSLALIIFICNTILNILVNSLTIYYVHLPIGAFLLTIPKFIISCIVVYYFNTYVLFLLPTLYYEYKIHFKPFLNVTNDTYPRGICSNRFPQL